MLTAWRDEDVNDLFVLFSDPRVTRFYDIPTMQEPEQAARLLAGLQQRFSAGTGIRWAMRDRDTGEFMGSCGFNCWDTQSRTAVLGYDLMPEFWGQGYASEAVSRIVEFAFGGGLSCGPLMQIEAKTVRGNRASERLLERLNFRLFDDMATGAIEQPDLKHYRLLQPQRFGELVLN
ncbi:GNAT family N-acetyltransferase [Ferrimonas pelagia]|uniref:GNAT family protein n=1 Tax=Ferrimonas pelagia TaxID=1177826 RepID=A0ABP9EE92_9GAMM